MNRKPYTEERIISILKMHEADASVPDISCDLIATLGHIKNFYVSSKVRDYALVSARQLAGFRASADVRGRRLVLSRPANKRYSIVK